jgi:hypothetical protein
MTIKFDGRVAIVTGAGGGLGRAYALELARRGAKVVVNDLGGSRDGTGHSDAALEVVEEIRAAGGTAVSNGGSVTEYDQMVEMVAKAKEEWGGVHVLINNAGILRDKSFAKMEPADFDLVLKVHVSGSANVTKACWDLMREQAYGRILMTASSTGLYGNFGQANYGAAKARPRGPDQDAPPRRREVQHPLQHDRTGRGHAHDRRHFPRRTVREVHARECRPGGAVPRQRRRTDQHDRRRRRRRVSRRFCYDDPRRGAARRRAHPEGVAAAWEKIIDRTGEIVPQSGSEQSMNVMKALMALG